MYPGPTIEAWRGQPLSVKFTNELPDRHLFHDAIDHTLEGSGADMPEVRTVVHLHGGRTLPESDGHPNAWFTRNFAETGAFFSGQTNYYSNDQPPCMLWYHDHAMGITRLNVVAGLAGLYIIREPGEQSLGLPRGRYEVPLVIQDRTFLPDGSILYPTQGLVPNVHPQWTPDYFGDVALVNGKVRPYLEVEPRKYRFRIVLGANATFYNLKLSSGQNFIQIGTELGFLPAPVSMPEILLSPAERADVIVDFSNYDGQDILLENDAVRPYPIGLFGPGPSPIMQFRVRRRSSGSDESRIPAELPAAPPLEESAAVLTRDIMLSEETVMAGPLHLPTKLLVEGLPFSAPVITTPAAGSTEIWRFINVSAVAHPMHIHLAHMQVLDRQFFDFDRYMQTQEIVTVGPPVPPAPNEVKAPKDTVRVDLASITRVLVKFDLPVGTELTPGKRFQYVHHCHMLEHEDNDMMRPFDIVVP